jgi:hypothetical protein
MKELLEVAHAFENEFRRGRYESRVARPAPADPVLAAPEFARLLSGSPAFRKKNAMDFANEA